ncbi:MAG: endolytic transglycosylase MltG [Pseudomonadota bacterium]|nr:endolytic transglycosylase MltG [Pseudomonadota bacterium]
MRTLLLLVTLVAGIAAAFAIDVLRVLQQPLNLAESSLFEIRKGQAFSGVAQALADQGFLPGVPRSTYYLKAYARVMEIGPQIKSGEYRLTPDMNALQAIQMFVDGRSVLHDLRLIEGWTFAQALAEVRKHPRVRQTMPDATPEAVYAALGRSDPHPEGRLFPDTYHFSKGITEIEFLQRAANTMDKVLAAEWAARTEALPYQSMEEALVMASIVEKETGAEHERTQIAGVFVRRLNLGMRLQTDPTVIYGLGTGFDGNLRLNDLRTDTPYNTYTRTGLPPSPICLPGRAAIHAALHPDSGSALFFVSRGDGTHVFSDTLEQHEAAVRRYQLGKR